MRISVVPICRHEDGWTSSGDPMIGKVSVGVTRRGVWLDGIQVIERDRRMIVNRTPGHPWLTSNGNPDPAYRNIGWTGFMVEVEA